MGKPNHTQLALLDLPESTSTRSPSAARRSGRRLSRADTVQHCNALLAELDRVTTGGGRRAVELARIFTAAEDASLRANDDRASVA